MTKISQNGAALLWVVLLTAASSLTNWVLACATPFAALAALAAVHMRRQEGLMLVGLAWMTSQVIGFEVLNYPHDARTIAWGFGMGASAMLSAFSACAALNRLADRPLAVRLAGAFIAAFIGYNAGLAVCALGLGGITTTLDPANLTSQFLQNAAILIGLFGFYRVLIAAGVPGPYHRVATA